MTKEEEILQAIKNCKFDAAASLIIEAGLNINLKQIPDYENPLIVAAENGYTDIVKLLIDSGADVNYKNPLITAVKNGHTNIVKLLMDAAVADVNYKDYVDNALIAAAYEGHTDIVKLLIDAGADVNYVNSRGDTALTLAEKFKGTDEGGEIVEILKPSETGRVDTAITNSSLDGKIFLIMAAVT